MLISALLESHTYLCSAIDHFLGPLPLVSLWPLSLALQFRGESILVGCVISKLIILQWPLQSCYHNMSRNLARLPVEKSSTLHRLTDLWFIYGRTCLRRTVLGTDIRRQGCRACCWTSPSRKWRPSFHSLLFPNKRTWAI